MEPHLLSELLSPMPMQDFLHEYYGKKPYARPFVANRYKNMINWSLLDHIMETKHNNCWPAKNGKLHPEQKFTSGSLTSVQARQCFMQGYTILVRHAEQVVAGLSTIAKDFEKLFNKPIDIQLYVTPAQEQGFDWHYDAEDVFVLQSHGEKEFRLRSDSPLAETRNRYEICCHLKAGDWLYIPAGYWHKAIARSDSFHISIGVLTSPQLLETLKSDLLAKK